MRRPTWASLKAEHKKFAINWVRELDPYYWMPSEIRTIHKEGTIKYVYYSNKVFDKTGVLYKTIYGDTEVDYQGEDTFTRPDGPAEIDVKRKIYDWMLFNKMHRIGGPASYSPGEMRWYLHGKLHRLDGPAIVDFTRMELEYHVNGKQLTEDEFFNHFGED